MARKRIKTLASEWGFPVEDLLAGCARLKLGHTQSESSLLSPEEADRLKADLDEQAHRATILRRETVLETSSGKIFEKRLNATVMRRRHAEPAASRRRRHAFSFRSRRESRDESFVVAVSRRYRRAGDREPVMFDSEPHAERRRPSQSHRAPEPIGVKPEPEIEEIRRGRLRGSSARGEQFISRISNLELEPEQKSFAAEPEHASGRGRSGASA